MDKRIVPFRNAADKEGRYSNYFKIGHNTVEFLIDFGQYYPEGEPVRMHTRIITSPVYAKALLDTLQSAVAQYEERHGIIPRQ